MKKEVTHFVMAVLLYCISAVYANDMLMTPSQVMRISSCFPPILGLMWGPAGILGAMFGGVLAEGEEWLAFLREMLATGWTDDSHQEILQLVGHVLFVSMMAFLPYHLWHNLSWLSKKPCFSLRPQALLNFVLVIFLATTASSIFFFFFMGESDLQRMFQMMGVGDMSTPEYMFLWFMNEFNAAVFFGIPILFLLISMGYSFHLPDGICEMQTSAEGESQDKSRFIPLLLSLFLMGIFLALSYSGILRNIGQIDAWILFNAEVLTTMNMTQIAFFCVILHFRHSIMTDFMMLEVITVFIAAFVLGTISFLSMSHIMDERMEETLESMSIISRERLSRSLLGIKSSVKSMHDLALKKLGSYEQFSENSAYRDRYFQEMEELFYPIACNTDGSISFYLRCVTELAGSRAGLYWTREAGHWEGNYPPFQRRYVTDISLYDPRELGWYYIPLQRHHATWIEPYVDVNTKAYVISYSMPIYFGDHAIGIVGMDVDFEYLTHEIRRMSVYEHGFAYLVDRNGYVLYHRDFSAGTALKKNPEMYETETYLGNGMWLGIAVPLSEIYADRNKMLVHLVVVMLLVAMAISLLSIWLAIRGIRPLLLLTEAVKRIAGGNLDIRLPYESRNEFGTLVNGIREMVSMLEIYVYRDKLTGLRNTAAYIRNVEEIKERRRKGRVSFAIVVFDANFLKKINDYYGHEAGNKLIKTAASMIRNVFAHSLVYRIGGDEFVAILEGRDYECREDLLKEFDKQAQQTVLHIDGKELPVSVARGMAVCDDLQAYEEVFQKADAAMYENKAAVKSQGDSW